MSKFLLFLLYSIVTMSLPSTIYEISTSNNYMFFESGLGVTQDHWKWNHSIDCVRVPVHLPLYLWPYLVLFLRQRKIVVAKSRFLYRLLHNYLGNTDANIFTVFSSQLSQICGISDGV